MYSQHHSTIAAPYTESNTLSQSAAVNSANPQQQGEPFQYGTMAPNLSQWYPKSNQFYTYPGSTPAYYTIAQCMPSFPHMVGEHLPTVPLQQPCPFQQPRQESSGSGPPNAYIVPRLEQNMAPQQPYLPDAPPLTLKAPAANQILADAACQTDRSFLRHLKRKKCFLLTSARIPCASVIETENASETIKEEGEPSMKVLLKQSGQIKTRRILRRLTSTDAFMNRISVERDLRRRRRLVNQFAAQRSRNMGVLRSQATEQDIAYFYEKSRSLCIWLHQELTKKQKKQLNQMNFHQSEDKQCESQFMNKRDYPTLAWQSLWTGRQKHSGQSPDELNQYLDESKVKIVETRKLMAVEKDKVQREKYRKQINAQSQRMRMRIASQGTISQRLMCVQKNLKSFLKRILYRKPQAAIIALYRKLLKLMGPLSGKWIQQLTFEEIPVEVLRHAIIYDIENFVWLHPN